MGTRTWSFQHGASRLTGLLLRPLRPRLWSLRLGRNGAATATLPIESYVRAVFEVLAVFRFFSFAMGAGLVFVLNPSDEPLVRLGLLMGVVGLYNMARVLWRFNPASYSPFVRWLMLGSDVLLSVALVLTTDGLESAFLIYSLAPILTASLLMDVGGAMGVAVVSGLSISGAHVLAELGVGDFPKILDGNYLAFALLYVAICLLIAYLPFLANLNWQRRVRSDSMASERYRLRREVHDNVAQTLAFLSLKVRRAEERASSPRGGLNSRDVMEIGSMVERAYLAVRDYLDDTHDAEFVEPLGTSLALAAGQWSRDTGLPVQMSLAETEDTLAPGVKRQMLQIAREALANVAKHANAGQVWVELEYSAQVATLRVRDDGRGFPASQPSGHGREIMAERAALIGATLDVTSAPGEGTEVVVTSPRNAEEGQP